MRVSEIMSSDPVSVARKTSLDAALELMDDLHIRHLPVVEDGTLVGIVSDRDLLEATGWLPKRVHGCKGPACEEQADGHVGDVMTAPVRTIGSSESACMASMHLVDRSIGCLPVVDAGRLVGIVTEADLLRTFLARIANGDSVPSRDPGTVEDHMTASPRTVHWYTTIGDATAICRSNGFRHLPVIEAGVLAGFLSDRDLRKAAGLSRQADTPVDEIMTRDVETISPLASMSDAATIMLQRRFSALPVVSDDEVVGILTMADVLDACLTAFDTGDEAAHPTHTG